MQPLNTHLTLSQIVRTLGIPRHTVDYAILTNNVEPAARVGITRLWIQDQLQEIRAAIRRTSKVQLEPIDSTI